MKTALFYYYCFNRHVDIIKIQNEIDLRLHLKWLCDLVHQIKRSADDNVFLNAKLKRQFLFTKYQTAVWTKSSRQVFCLFIAFLYSHVWVKYTLNLKKKIWKNFFKCHLQINLLIAIKATHFIILQNEVCGNFVADRDAICSWNIRLWVSNGSKI